MIVFEEEERDESEDVRFLDLDIGDVFLFDEYDVPEIKVSSNHSLYVGEWGLASQFWSEAVGEHVRDRVIIPIGQVKKIVVEKY